MRAAQTVGNGKNVFAESIGIWRQIQRETRESLVVWVREGGRRRTEEEERRGERVVIVFWLAGELLPYLNEGFLGDAGVCGFRAFRGREQRRPVCDGVSDRGGTDGGVAGPTFCQGEHGC